MEIFMNSNLIAEHAYWPKEGGGSRALSRHGGVDSINEMVRSGLQLIRVPRGRKGPVTPDWNLPGNAIKDEADTEQLLGQNIGLALAYCQPKPVGSIDIDNLPEAENWLQRQGVRLTDLLRDPHAVGLQSGKKNSLKIFGALSEPLPSVRILGSDGSMALELRCADAKGRTLQDLVPPSVHPSGSFYSFIGGGSILRRPDMPNTILEIWQSEIVRRQGKCLARSRVGEKRLSTWAETPRNIAIVKDMLSKVSADCDYQMWRNTCWAVLSLDWSCSEDLAQAWSRTAPERYNEEAFWLVVNSYDPHVASPITVGSLVHYARQGA
jgi:putative DNA primase/helicase